MMIYESELYHHGILGQKWGKRNGPPYPLGSGNDSQTANSDIKTWTKSGVEITLSKNHTSRFSQFLSKFSKSVRDNVERDSSYKIKQNNKTVGELYLSKESDKSLNVVWISISKKYENNGYGSAVMQAVVDYGKKSGYDQITLEVPGDSPNARHIYEELGFKAVDKITDEDDVWGGLTSMILKLNR